MPDSVDIGVMRRICERLFVPVVHGAFGEEGMAALREVLEFLPQHYALASPELINGTLWVMRSLRPEGLANAVSGAARIEHRIDRLPRRVENVTVLELLDTGAFRVWEGAAVDVAAASAVAIVYRFTPGHEDFIVRDKPHAVVNPAPEHISVFARPTFASLRDALEDYRNRSIRASTCYIFRDAWEDSARLFFKPAPEWRMRRSLQQYLTNRIRGVDVLAEQAVDESHPVDITVTWTFTRAEALIEIKWLGKSRCDGRIVAHSDQRARDGAAQLADYLDKHHTTKPGVDAKGYLVVIDGRRKGLAADAIRASTKNGMHYANSEIEFRPKYHDERVDFEVPIRMFAEPVCTPEEDAA